MKTTLTSLQAFIAPITLPIAPAMVLGNEIHKIMVQNGLPFWMAVVGGTLSAIGLETAAGASCWAAVKTARRGQWGQFIMASVGVFLYVAFIGLALYWLPQSQVVVVAGFAGLIPVGYVAYALVQGIREEDQVAVVETELEIEKIEAEKRLVNARNRLAKTESGTVRVSGRTSDKESNDTEKQVHAYMDKHPDASARQAAADLNLGKSQVNVYQRTWRQNGHETS